MLTCPNPTCKKQVQGTPRQCPRCQADLGILVDYLADLDGSLEKAEAKTRAGQLGEAIWAYLEVLEVDPDNPEAKRQIGAVVTAVRQFDEVMPGRRWADRIRKQARIRKVKEDIVDLTPRGWIMIFSLIMLLAVMLLLGFGWGWAAALAPPEPAASPSTQSQDKDKSTKPKNDKGLTTPPKKGKSDPKAPPGLGP